MSHIRSSREIAGTGGHHVEPPPRLLADLLEATPVRFNGSNPYDIQVRDPATYRRILMRGTLGFGEAYVDGLWECQQLDTLFTELLRADVRQRVDTLPRLRLLLRTAADLAVARFINRQSQRRVFRVGERHYDIGNDVFQAMLDPTMSYSCAYWAHAHDLDQAQRDKLDMICRKLELSPGERLLDIGCGWGGLARHAAQHYGVEVLGVTISRQQLTLARERCAGLPVSIELMDYRDLQGHFDKIVSVGMFEHVGPKNYRRFFDVAQRLLAEDGAMLLHTIGDSATNIGTDPWIDKYIFPNGKLPSAQQITAAIEPGLVIRDWHEFGHDYDRTLMAWWANFNRAWSTLRDSYSQRFYRTWKYYLHACAAGFRSGRSQLWQIVLTPLGARPGYRSIRPKAANR